ncbi:MAG: hypothetical protein ACLS6H_14830, partial [Clostridium sp.]
HISAYSLIIEEGTPFGTVSGRKTAAADIQVRLFQMRIQKIKSTVLHGNFFRNRALSAMRYLTMQNREKPVAIILVTGQRLPI